MDTYLLTSPSNVLPYYPKETFPPIFEFSLKVMGLNPGYLLKSFLSYLKTLQKLIYIPFNASVCHNSSHAAAAISAVAVAPPPSPQHIGPFSLFTLHNFKVSVPTRLGCRQIAALTTLPKNKLICPKNIGASMEIEMNNRQQ